MGLPVVVAGVGAGYFHWYGTSSFVCTACRNAGGPDAGEWITVNPSVSAQKRPDEVDGLKITVMVLPPEVPAGAGQIQLIHQGEVYGYAALSLCPRGCRRAVVQYLKVAEARRRRGVGRVLVEAVRARCEKFAVTTAPLPSDPASVRFWAQVGLLGPQQPRPCGHQSDAGIASMGWEDAARRANRG
ncbi:GNAT family N-acetyltransferase [Amycolatopsis sp. cmx-11-32]|uniref:GNAT family N-acetyltransferase n=1 Tax=Amycolatopsis sp. cmx-11-32 TaxID=2785796 RepID=UPI0039E6F41B